MRVGQKVQIKHEARVMYGPAKPDDVVPAGTLGVVSYLPEEETDAGWVGVTWDVNGSTIGVEVREDEVTLV